MDCVQLTKAQRWQMADWLAEDRLPEINKKCKIPVYRETFYTRYGKRVIDIIVSLLMLIITLPINLLIGIVTYFDVGRPIFFSQTRLGKDGKEFRIVKFRNMRNTTDERGELLPPDQRVTKWGNFVRRTSLDELLNFWSVLKGDMSLIGPRPLPPEYLGRYNDRHKMRLVVKPGLECPPRERLINAWTWNEKFENDIWYIEHISFWVDCKMLMRLVQYAFDKKNSEVRGFASKGTFFGYDKNGVAIEDIEHVPQEYIDRASKVMNSMTEAS